MTYTRAAIILIKNNKILLMHRIKQGREYFVIPGGHCEENETEQECAIREFKEETTINVTDAKLLFNFKDEQSNTYYYLAKSYTGEPKLSGPELKRQSIENFYELVWAPIKNLEKINLLPPEIDKKILDNIK